LIGFEFFRAHSPKSPWLTYCKRKKDAPAKILNERSLFCRSVNSNSKNGRLHEPISPEKSIYTCQDKEHFKIRFIIIPSRNRMTCRSFIISCLFGALEASVWEACGSESPEMHSRKDATSEFGIIIMIFDKTAVYLDKDNSTDIVFGAACTGTQVWAATENAVVRTFLGLAQEPD
jgi:hypothetical protein